MAKRLVTSLLFIHLSKCFNIDIIERFELHFLIKPKLHCSRDLILTGLKDFYIKQKFENLSFQIHYKNCLMKD